MRVTTGFAKGKALKVPKGLDTRPTSDKIKQVIFNAIQFDIYGREALDLFAGSGQMGIEALSRGAKSCIFVDKDPRAIQAIKENLKNTGLEKDAAVVCADCLSFISSLSARDIGLVFIDPPYGKGLINDVMSLIAARGALKKDCIIVAESHISDELEEKFGDFVCAKKYIHGMTKVSIYKIGDEDENCGMSGQL